MVAPAAQRLGVSLQLDPSFQPHFALYDGLVLKLVCESSSGVPLEVASGGRYDALVGRFCGDGAGAEAAGMGFGFAVGSLRELLCLGPEAPAASGPTLVCVASSALLARALDELEALHGAGEAAELHGQPVASQAEAEGLARQRGCCRALWLAA